MTMDDADKLSGKQILNDLYYPFVGLVTLSFFADRDDEVIFFFLDDFFGALAGFDTNFDIHKFIEMVPSWVGR